MKRALTLLLLLLLTAAVSGVDVFSIPRKKPSAPVSYEVGKTGSGGGGSAFYGIPVDKRQRVLFLIDLSGSMTARTPEGISRIDAMKKELVSMLSPPRNSEEKSGNGSFFLVKYESKVSCFPPEKRFYPFRSILHIETALRHIRKLEASGGTVMGAAWNEVFQLAETNEIDTIFFLTDGEPTDCSEQDVLRMVNTWNSRHHVTIHCIAIGRESVLLRELAEANGGIYRVRM